MNKSGREGIARANRIAQAYLITGIVMKHTILGQAESPIGPKGTKNDFKIECFDGFLCKVLQVFIFQAEQFFGNEKEQIG